MAFTVGQCLTCQVIGPGSSTFEVCGYVLVMYTLEVLTVDSTILL